MMRSGNPPRDPTRGFLYALAGTALLSTNFVTAKYALQGFNPPTFALLWTIAASFYSFLIVLATGGWKHFILPKPSVLPVILIGVGTGIGMLFGWEALARLDPSFTAFLSRFRPVLIIILSSLVLRERLSFKELIPIGVMLIGCVGSAVGRWEVVGTGILLASMAIFMASVQQVIAKIAVSRAHPTIMVFYRVFIAALIIGTWNLLTGRADFDVPTSHWLVLALGALLGPTLSFHLMYRSYRYWDLSRSSMVLITQPLFVLPLAYVFLDLFPARRELLGGGLIFLGALWLAWIHFSAGKRAELPVAVPKQAEQVREVAG
jgi:drug/metabolite transporter (DMT)-like permease